MTPPVSLIRRLPGLGYSLHRLAEAARVLRLRMKRGTLPEVAEPLLAQANQRLPVSRRLTVLLAWRGLQWQLLAAGDTLDERVLADPASATCESPLLLAAAMARLPALRPLMRRELRHARYDRLARVLPQVWWLSPEIPPPGAVIGGGLGIPAWKDMGKALASGRDFDLIDLDDSGAEMKRHHLEDKSAAQAPSEGLRLMQERTSAQAPAEGWVLARYEAAEPGSWKLVEAQSRSADESAWQRLVQAPRR